MARMGSFCLTRMHPRGWIRACGGGASAFGCGDCLVFRASTVGRVVRWLWLSRVGLAVVPMCVAVGALAGCGKQSGVVGRGAADAMTVFTIAGASSQAAYPCRPVRDECQPPPGFGRRWQAGERRFSGTCLTHLADATILLCHGGQLFALSPAGMMRRWPRRGGGAGVGELYGTAAAPDGSVMVIGQYGVARCVPRATRSEFPACGSTTR